MTDAARKGRMAKKLTEDDVLDIRELYATGDWTQEDLAEEFGASRSHIGRILSGKKWRHI